MFRKREKKTEFRDRKFNQMDKLNCCEAINTKLIISTIIYEICKFFMIINCFKNIDVFEIFYEEIVSVTWTLMMI